MRFMGNVKITSTEYPSDKYGELSPDSAILIC